MKHGCFGVFLLAAGLGQASLARSGEAPAELAQPPSPGSIALLAEAADRADAERRLSEALGDPRPEVRAAAARVAHARGSRALDERILAALEAEAEPVAAGEMIRALATAASPAVDEKLIEAARRLGPLLGGVVAEALGRSRGTLAQRRLAALRSLELSTTDFVRASTQGGIDALAQMGRAALNQGEPALWAATLRVARETRQRLSDETLLEALKAEAIAIRDETAWHLALLAAAGTKPSAGLQSVVETAPAMADAGFMGRELLRRACGNQRVEQRAWLEALRTGDPTARARAAEIVREDHIVEWLTRAEREAVAGAVLGDRKALSGTRDRDRTAVTLPQATPVRTLDDFPPRFLSDLMAVSGCSPGDDAAEAAEISYGPDGRPLKIALASLALPERCRPAVRAMFVCSILPRGYALPANLKHVVLAALDRQVIASFDETMPPSPNRPGSGASFGSSVKEPRKLKNVPPGYPDAAREKRIEGSVVLEAVIASSGSVRTVRTLTSVHPSLDFAAVRAVSQWRYTPTILNGAAVPVIMTVTVNFSLR